MFERLKHMLIKEFIQGLRDPRMKMMIFVVPVIQLVVFGYAVTTDVKHILTAVYDLDNSVTSRELVSRLANSGYFDVMEYAGSDRRVRELLDHGDVQCVVRLNKGFAEDVEAGRTAPVQILLDGTDSNTAGIVLSYAGRIVSQFSQELLESRFARLRGAVRQPGRVEVQTRAWFNENLESRNYYVPGVISTIVTLMSLILTSMAVVREKEIGTMEQIMVTPMKPAEFILGKTIPFALISFMDVVLVSVVGVLWFGIPIRGNPLVLLLGVLLFLMTTLGIGLFISTISHTQQQAMMTSFFFFMPAMLLSGFMFPIANMPEPIQWVTLLNPLRYFLVIIRGVFLKGVGLEVLWPQMLALAVLGTFTLWVTSRRFHKTLA
jgi:ABC-2 type transport system permease protein